MDNHSLRALVRKWDERVRPYSGPDLTTGFPSLVVKPARPQDQCDALSLIQIKTNVCAPFMEALKSVARILSQSAPMALTSCFRTTGTHRFGAIDIAPNLTSEQGYGHPLGWDPRLFARPELLHLLVDIVSDLPAVHMLVEDNHIHLHDANNPGIPPELISALYPSSLRGKQDGAGRVAIQVNPRKGYRRTQRDSVGDDILTRRAFWVPLDHDLISALPPHIKRF